MAGRTQRELYAQIDTELSWSESDLPERERTKHVHRLHPYLGKYPPQLVEVLLRRRFAPGALIYDPFAGSGTTLVEATVQGMPALGCDVSAFNCLLTGVKSAPPDPPAAAPALEPALPLPLEPPRQPWLERWYAPRRWRSDRIPCRARGSPNVTCSASPVPRLRPAAPTTLDDTAPRHRAYWCHKHCRGAPSAMPPGSCAATPDTVLPDRVRRPRRDAPGHVLHARARSRLPDGIDGVVTSPHTRA